MGNIRGAAFVRLRCCCRNFVMINDRQWCGSTQKKRQIPETLKTLRGKKDRYHIWSLRKVDFYALESQFLLLKMAKIEIKSRFARVAREILPFSSDF